MTDSAIDARNAGDQATRNEFIQAMRFVAAALVLVTHATFYYHERIDRAVEIWRPGGIGVPIFFVISGFVMVVASAKLTRDAAGARVFFARRLLRIVPLYWLVTLVKVAIALAAPAVVHHNHFDLIYAVKSFLFIPAYNAAGEVHPIHGVGWTLLHEMFFYIVFATVMLFHASPVRYASLFILLMYGLGLLVAPSSAFMEVVTHPINLHFVVGMLLGSAALRDRLQAPAPLALLIALVALALGKLFVPAVMAWVPFDSAVLLLGCAMMLLASWKPPRLFNVPVALGDSSYALYLFHPLIAPPALMLNNEPRNQRALPSFFLTHVAVPTDAMAILPGPVCFVLPALASYTS